jgi:hypothetical protein
LFLLIISRCATAANLNEVYTELRKPVFLDDQPWRKMSEEELLGMARKLQVREQRVY